MSRLNFFPLPLTGSQISYQHLQFKQIPVSICSDTGKKRTKWVDSGMPKIPTIVLGCVVYLYQNRKNAESGSEYGGTGFLVSLPSEKDNRYYYVYAVTNYHVIAKGATTIRVGTESGKPDILEFSENDWKYVPGGGDVAVCSLRGHLREDYHKATVIPLTSFATKNIIDQHRIGIGDDVFMVGRFIDHDGGPSNSPAVRFGNISVMPMPIEPMANGVKDSYCIDLHSRSGFSGSPVFVYRTPGNDIEQSFLMGASRITAGFLYFLGIHWGQFPEVWEIGGKEKTDEVALGLIGGGKYVKGFSGMTCVMPVEPILDALNIQSLRDERSRGDAELENKFETSGYPVNEE